MILLSSIIEACDPVKITGPQYGAVTGVAYNSMKIKEGFLFVAIKGYHTDGHIYIENALEKGASAVIYETPLEKKKDGITYIHVKDSKKALAEVSAAFFGFPGNKLTTIGVTGTDGKSSTVWFTQQLLELVEKKSGFISTVSIQTEEKAEANPFRQSTPESLEINIILDKMVKQNKEYSVIEATSHGLSKKTSRLTGLSFNAAVFTNITHEHLEFHGTFEQYREDKANLFRHIAPGGFGVVNKDDPNYEFFKMQTGQPVYTYSIKDPEADFYGEIRKADLKGTDFDLQHKNNSYPCRINLPGHFNVSNILAALITVKELTGLTIQQLIEKLPLVEGVTGRVKIVDKGQPFDVIVDYAHTPKSFENIFSLIKPMTKNRLITVFGSAGERDLIKRPIQGEMASRFSDIIILTDEDPRGEDSLKILKDIARGCKDMKENQNLFLIPDRRKAIAEAFNMALPGDTVLTLGKGHESSIIYADGSIHWNEIGVCEELLSK